MTESAYSSIHGAEISERSPELVLPGSASATARDEPDDDGHTAQAAVTPAWRTTPLATTGEASEIRAARRVAEIVLPGDVLPGSAAVNASAAGSADFASAAFSASAGASRSPATAVSTQSPNSAAAPPREPEIEFDEVLDPGADGLALPGDRGPREAELRGHRPSFWRRIALGRRTQSLRAAQQAAQPPAEQTSPRTAPGAATAATTDPGTPALTPARATRAASSAEAESELVRSSDALVSRANAAAERRIVEPLLQALVSVEAKLERSHVDLLGRSDQVEQRLTQLWDIEEQLGTLGELQESVLHVTEQPRRREAALVAQTRILRWLVGGIILSLSVAAFAVAFFLAGAR